MEDKTQDIRVGYAGGNQEVAASGQQSVYAGQAPASAANVVYQPTDATPTPPLAIRRAPGSLRRWLKWGGLGVLVLLLVGGAWLAVGQILAPKNAVVKNAADRFDNVRIPLDGLDAANAVTLGARSLSVNGALRANDGFIISPSAQPGNASRGQLYFDQATNQLGYFNGTQFVSVADTTNAVGSVGGISGQIVLGSGLAIAGGQLSNAGVLSIQGQNGALTLGGGLGIAAGTLSNTGIVSVASGSANLTVATDGSGNVVITNMAGSGTVQSPGGTAGRIAKFSGAQTIEDSLLSESGTTLTLGGSLDVTGGITLGTALSVSNGGTGTTALTVNGVVIGGGSGALMAVTAGGSGQCLLSTGGAPAFGACPGSGAIAGTPGKIAKFTSGSTVGDSILTESGATVTVAGTVIATIAAQAPLFDTASAGALAIGTTNATAVNLNQNTTVAAGKNLVVTSGLTTLSAGSSGDALTVSNGTSAGNILVLKDNATTVATVADGGAVLLQNSADSQTAFRVLTAGSSSVLNVDTQNQRVGIGGIAVASKLEVNGGEAAIYNSGSNPRLIIGDSTSAGQNGYLQWDSTNDYIRLETIGTNGLKINDNFLAIGNIFPDQPLKVGNGSTLLAQIGTTGAAFFQNSANSTSAFRVLNAAGTTTVLDADTTNGRIGINTAAPSERLTVTGNLNVRDADTPAMQARLRTNGSFIDFEGAGDDLALSIWDNADFTGSQRTKAIFIRNSNLSVVLGSWDWYTGTFGVRRHSISADSAGQVIFNDDSEATNFTIKGSSDPNAFVLEGLTSSVGIGTNSPQAKLHVNSTLTTDLFAVTDATASAADVFKIHDEGAAEFKTRTNNTTAFQVLNASSVPAFVVDTTNMAVKIGGGDVSPSATPGLFVIDHKSTAGDPTGVNGGSYYNASTNKFRCYENSAWKNCLGLNANITIFGQNGTGASSTWDNMPAGLTEFMVGVTGLANPSSRVLYDLTDAQQVRFQANVESAGSTNAELRIQYSTDQSTWNYLDQADTGLGQNLSTTGFKSSSWANIASGAQGDVYLRVVGINGDASADPDFGLIQVQAR